MTRCCGGSGCEARCNHLKSKRTRPAQRRTRCIGSLLCTHALIGISSSSPASAHDRRFLFGSWSEFVRSPLASTTASDCRLCPASFVADFDPALILHMRRSRCPPAGQKATYPHLTNCRTERVSQGRHPNIVGALENLNSSTICSYPSSVQRAQTLQPSQSRRRAAKTRAIPPKGCPRH